MSSTEDLRHRGEKLPWALTDIFSAMPAFALVLFRMTGLMITAPVFASRIIPGRVRGALIMAMAAMTFPLVRPQTPLDVTWGGVIAGSVGEMMIGLAIEGRARLGVVYQPEQDKLYRGVVGGDAVLEREGKIQQLRVSDAALDRLRKFAGRRLTKNDEIVIHAESSRSQLDNKNDCIRRLRELVARAAIAPKSRKKKKPTKAMIERRLEKKRKQSEKKTRRSHPSLDEQ